MIKPRVAYFLVVLGLFAGVSSASAEDAVEKLKLIKKLEAKFEPAEAKPGQTVTLKLSILLENGWVTYPTVQPEKAAGSSVTKITFPAAGSILFVGKVQEPAGAKSKAEPDLGVEKMLYYPGGGTWERKAVVLPTAKAGKTSVKLTLGLLICSTDKCLPKSMTIDVPLTVAGEPVAVDPAFKAEVEKAAKP